MRVIVGATLGAAVPLVFIALSWLTPEQQLAIAVFFDQAMPWFAVLACASLGASIASVVEVDNSEKEDETHD